MMNSPLCAISCVCEYVATMPGYDAVNVGLGARNITSDDLNRLYDATVVHSSKYSYTVHFKTYLVWLVLDRLGPPDLFYASHTVISANATG